MGIGDELLAAGEAQRIRAQTGNRVRIIDQDGRARWHSLWDGNDAILQPEEARLIPHVTLPNYRGHRQHILEHSRQRFVFNPTFRATPARITLTEPERAFARAYSGAIIIEPNVKANAPNKQWGLDRWRDLVDLLHGVGIHPVQLGPRSVPVITGAMHVVTETIREAAAVMSVASAAVLPEGGLHHIAAAVRLRAVVIFGGFIDPRITGYAMHRNLFTAQEACGNRRPCEHCRAAMEKIEPRDVLRELQDVMLQRRPA